MTEKIEKITQQEIDIRKIASLPTRPNNPRPYGGEFLSPEKLKERFDALSLLIIDRLNPLIEKINNGEIAKHIPALTVADEEFTLYDLAKKIIDGTLPDIMKVYEEKTLRVVLEELYSAYKDVATIKELVEEAKGYADSAEKNAEKYDELSGKVSSLENELINVFAVEAQLDEIIALQEDLIGGEAE